MRQFMITDASRSCLIKIRDNKVQGLIATSFAKQLFSHGRELLSKRTRTQRNSSEQSGEVAIMVSGNVLVTGANRGIGLELVKQLVLVPEVQLVLATCRFPNEAQELQNLANENPKVQILQLDVSNPESIENVAKIVGEKVGKNGLNLLINNAGILRHAPKLELLKADQMMENYATNTVAPLMLTQALLPLLEKAAAIKQIKKPDVKAAVVNISSDLGSLALIPDLHTALMSRLGNLLPYNCSKAALNMVTRCIAVEKPDIMVVSIHPGWVATDMGGPSATLTGEQSASAIVKTLQGLKSEHSGGYFNWEGESIPW